VPWLLVHRPEGNAAARETFSRIGATIAFFGQHAAWQTFRPLGVFGVVSDFTGDNYEMTIRGAIEQTSILGERIRMTREIKAWLGENRITIRDVVACVPGRRNQ
jgi:hypothetical protein